MVRLTFDQRIQAFGDYRPHMLADGTIGASWERQIIAYAKLPAPLRLSWDPKVSVTRFKCHRLLVPHFESLMQDIFNDPPVWKDWEDGGFGGCYEFRANRRNPRELSMHSWGAAVDGDVADNPQGVKPQVHDRLPAIFERNGFLWGGLFQRSARDGMHAEFADLSRLKP